jgi:predicted DNA-binding transcriptional regulator YafY
MKNKNDNKNMTTENENSDMTMADAAFLLHGGEFAGLRTRPPFDRMKTIFTLIKDGTYPNATSVAIELGVAVKTVHRDIAFMRDRWELPIAYDVRNNGYYFSEPVDRFPGVPVTEKELFALCVAQKAIEQYQGTALQQPLELAFQKCMGRLDDSQRFTLQNLDEVLSFRPFGPEDADLKTFELVTAAIRERRGLQFEYRKPGEKLADVRRVHPYHLMQFSSRWYLLAWDAQAQGVRNFVLGRMHNAQLTAEKFTVPRGFDPKKFFDRSLGVMTGAGDYAVVIEMDAWLTDVLRGRRWHPGQEWTELPGGGSHLTLRLSCLEEIEQWVLSWGDHATVIQPTALRQRIFNTLESLLPRYAPDGAQPDQQWVA